MTGRYGYNNSGEGSGLWINADKMKKDRIPELSLFGGAIKVCKRILTTQGEEAVLNWLIGANGLTDEEKAEILNSI